jgi:hypothetical protein
MDHIGEPVTVTLASGDQAEVIRLGAAIGLGIATGDGAAMGTLTREEAQRLAAELTWLAGD